MALDPDRDGDVVAGVDDSSVLSGPHEYVGPLRRKTLQVNTRGFIRTVLRPHDSIERKFEKVGFTAQNPYDFLVLSVTKPERAVDGLKV
jgi:hypothetical protein